MPPFLATRLEITSDVEELPRVAVRSECTGRGVLPALLTCYCLERSEGSAFLELNRCASASARRSSHAGGRRSCARPRDRFRSTHRSSARLRTPLRSAREARQESA